MTDLVSPPASTSHHQLGDTFRFWLWLNTTVLRAMYNIERYNGALTTRRERRYLTDQVSFRVGPARVRQLRIKPGEWTPPEVGQPPARLGWVGCWSFTFWHHMMTSTDL